MGESSRCSEFCDFIFSRVRVVGLRPRGGCKNVEHTKINKLSSFPTDRISSMGRDLYSLFIAMPSVFARILQFNKASVFPAVEKCIIIINTMRYLVFLDVSRRQQF